MNMRCAALITVLILLAAARAGFAEEGQGGQAGAFLRLPVGARPAGMGNSFVSVADDVNALYYNPGGLYQVEETLFGAMFAVMSLDRSHYQASFVHKLDRFGTFAFLFNKFGVSDIDGRDSQGSPTSSFDDSELALSFGLGRKFFDHLGAGAAFKYVSHSLQDNKATGIGVDLGVHTTLALEDPILNAIRFGFSVSDLGAKLKWDTSSSHEDDIPFTMRFGSGFDVTLRDIGLLVTLEGSRTNDETTEFHTGVETWLHRVLGVRFGVQGNDLSFGVSVKYNRFRIDYALTGDELEEGATNKIGVQVGL